MRWEQGGHLAGRRVLVYDFETLRRGGAMPCSDACELRAVLWASLELRPTARCCALELLEVRLGRRLSLHYGKRASLCSLELLACLCRSCVRSGSAEAHSLACVWFF